jgi:NAD(P)-dependent dehydrogenase (short-subunit alcohol dehydrogenase family)
MATGICEGRVCIVTGAGRGLGREYALMLAAEGAKVVVNDLGGSRDGTGGDAGPAQQVVDEIAAAGGQAVANTDDIRS